MFEAKLNYITAGMALVFLILLSRIAYMQVFNHEQYAAQAEQMRTGQTLLEPQRADIVLRDGAVVAHTESVWDIYLDLEAFADPRTIELRAHISPGHYDRDEIAEFTARVNAVREMPLMQPALRRRFFCFWKLRQEPVARKDFELCAQRLCMLTGLGRGELEVKLELISTEVNALLEGLGELETARGRDVSVAWLRASPALRDPEYWERIRRFPKSLHFAPVLRARLEWFEKEAEYLQGLLKSARGDREMLRDLCFQAMRAARDRADSLPLEVDPTGLSLSQAQDILLEEHDAWLRIARTCEEVVRGDAQAVRRRHGELTGSDGVLRRTRERLERLEQQIIARYANDWQQRWRHYEFDENPLLLVRDAPRDVVELLKVNGDALPGVRAVRRATRRYANARELVHVIGSVGLPDPAGLERALSRSTFGEGLEDFIEQWFEGDQAAFSRRFEGQVAQHLIGRSGLELTYDERLAGLYGARVSTRDARGRIRAIEFEQAPTHPAPLTLTIDMDLQKDLIETLTRWEPALAAAALSGRHGANWQGRQWTFRGCAVVLDVETGAVLGMVSLPDYDPERLQGRTAADRAYQRQFQLEQKLDEQLPWWNRRSRMLNKATTGLYAPGSTLKVLTALALLDAGVVTPRDTFDEMGRYRNGSYEIFHDGRLLGSTSHPVGMNVNMRLALEASSNGYFYRWIQDMGPSAPEAWENMLDYAYEFGIGMPAGGDFHARRARLPRPDEVWPRELAMLSIGQGAMTTTPMEIARLYAAIANRGTLVVPHISDEAMIWPRRIDLPGEVWDAVHDGMRRVIEGPRGTARSHPVLKRIRCAGKTGTAENGRGVPNHAWFAGFAPHDDPKVAFVILAANSDVYGGDISPIIGEVIERHFQRRGIE